MTDQTPTPARVDLDNVGALLWQAYRDLGKQIDELAKPIADLTEKRARVREQLEARIGTAHEARVNGTAVISWKPSKPAMQIDAPALKKDHPKIYAAYLVAKKAARPFKLLDDSGVSINSGPGHGN